MQNNTNDQGKEILLNRLLPALRSDVFAQVEQDKLLDNMPEVQNKDLVLSALKSRLFARDGAYKHSSYVTLNIMESMVDGHIEEIIHRFNSCSCDRCKFDIAALALNNLPPKYIVVEKNEKIRFEDRVETKQVLNALVAAVIKVRSDPRH